MRRQESECRRQVSLLEARLLEAGVKNSRRRDLLQLQVRGQVGWLSRCTRARHRRGGAAYSICCWPRSS